VFTEKVVDMQCPEDLDPAIGEKRTLRSEELKNVEFEAATVGPQSKHSKPVRSAQPSEAESECSPKS